MQGKIQAVAMSYSILGGDVDLDHCMEHQLALDQMCIEDMEELALEKNKQYSYAVCNIHH